MEERTHSKKVDDGDDRPAVQPGSLKRERCSSTNSTISLDASLSDGKIPTILPPSILKPCAPDACEPDAVQLSDLSPEEARSVLELNRPKPASNNGCNVSSDSDGPSSPICPLERYRKNKHRHELIATGHDVATAPLSDGAVLGRKQITDDLAHTEPPPPQSQPMDRYLEEDERHETLAVRLEDHAPAASKAEKQATPPPDDAASPDSQGTISLSPPPGPANPPRERTATTYLEDEGYGGDDAETSIERSIWESWRWTNEMRARVSYKGRVTRVRKRRPRNQD